MAKDKKSFILYCDQKGVWDKLDDAQAGKLIKHIIAYVNDENPSAPDFITELAFEPIKQQLKRDLKNWEQTTIKRSEAGVAGAKARWQTMANDGKRISGMAKMAVNESVNVNENVTVNGNVNERVTPTRDFNWFRKQIDEIWTDQLPTDKKKNLGAAIQNAWEYLSADQPRLRVIEARECKQLVSKAFQFLKTDTNGTFRRNQTVPQSTQSFSGDYSGNGGPILRSDIDL